MKIDYLAPQVIYTRITPPPLQPRMLRRPRVVQRLKQAFDYRLTLLQAEAGCGKSTALAELAAEAQPLIWYAVSDEDGDPAVFLLHLCHAIRRALPAIAALPTSVIEGWDGDLGPLPWRGVLGQVVNALSASLNAPTLLVVDDVHHVLHNSDMVQLLDRLVNLAPPHLHILLAGRPPIALPGLRRLRLRGEALLLDQHALAFTASEIATLFTEHYGLSLSSAQIDALLNYTEGWPIALQLIWQNLRGQALAPRDWSPHWRAVSPAALFDLLAQEVFARQPADVQHFLVVTATLRELTPAACDALLQGASPAQRMSADSMLTYLKERELFVVETAGGPLRYHYIFHTFLRQQASPEEQRRWHRIAADHFIEQQDMEGAIHHLLEAKAWEEVATLLDVYANRLVTAGRLDTLAAYFAALPTDVLHRHPMLLLTLGKLERLRSRFDEAMRWYKEAEAVWRAWGQPDGIARALRGQARVYLDTIDPSQAERLLEEAEQLSDSYEDREAQIRLFEMLAENKLNAGRIEEAERLRRRAESLRPEGSSNEELRFHMLLRTGRLREAREGLEAQAQAEQATPVQTPRAHRETLLLLSLICAFQGEAERAYQAAVEGVRRGEMLRSPLITAMAHIRQGHARQLLGVYSNRAEAYALARQCYEKGVEFSRMLAVPRLRVEAGWGLCRTYGYAGDLSAALRCAEEALDIAEHAGDRWSASMVRLTLGAGHVLAGDFVGAEAWLSRAVAGFEACSDPFGRCSAQLWLALSCFRQKQFDRLAQLLPEVLTTCRANGYGFLWTRPTLVGAADERVFTPLLLMATRNGWESDYATSLLDALNLSRVELHPGYQLRVQTLGAFRVWRGDEPIPPNGWKRKPARLLFQLLITHRGEMLDREQICEALWPEVDPVTAQQNFKFALNALYSVLEPARTAGAESAYIVRDGAAYGIRPSADLWIDVDQFLKEVKASRSDPDRMERALALYQGEYLPDARYEAWAIAERERLAMIFLENADRLTERLLEEARYEDAIDLCQRMLAQDNCWERAYRHLMIAYHGLGDYGQIARVYRRCVQTLREELDVDPAPETKALFRTLSASG
ncbi:MAG: BTAD domain-containing putative transcriptional regulator [Caldilinea sp.]|uniref:BTAD domain-containing putative transcriptional regulator n=1 Tax=Caldilinea sp. TaxID=2293560 RepID=UPI0030A155D5